MSHRPPCESGNRDDCQAPSVYCITYKAPSPATMITTATTTAYSCLIHTIIRLEQPRGHYIQTIQRLTTETN